MRGQVVSDYFIHADCSDALTDGRVETGPVNLGATSPSYADQRAGNYGGIHPADYVDWFLPRAKAIQDCITEESIFVLNIKEEASN